MIGRQAAARRGLRLRRRLPPRQPWAAHLYNQAIARGHRHPHAVRILARAWIYVVWKCWRDHKAYDPATRALQALLNDPATAA
ncbi:MAG: hypothetical protein ACRDRK_27865 [Pseudonocardia sp.]